jgi:Ca-activated chloride channel family protein
MAYRLLHPLIALFASGVALFATGCGGGSASYGGGAPNGGARPPYVDTSAARTNATDKYAAVGTNPFVATAYDPLSTFAVDVDTASYDIFRRDVNLGMLPQPAGVRLEEYVNDFRYDYPAPASADIAPFSITLGAARGLFDRDTVLFRVGIRAFDPSAEAKRPANLVFLVDVSGSMQTPDKLPLVQRILSDTLDVLDATDTVSIVTYAGSTGVRLGPTPVANRAAILPVINGLAAGGSTSGAAGLMLAYAQARAGFIEGGINHVLLCTDGDFNVGPSSTAELLALIKQERQSGVTLTTLGFGVGNLNDAMMEAVSDAGNGIYGVISSAEQADSYARERMLSTIVRVANNMKVQVAFNPASVTAYRLLGYEDRAVADANFRNDAVDGGEVGAGHRVTALYELVMAGQDVPAPAGAPVLLEGTPAVTDGSAGVALDDLAHVAIRYQAIGDAVDAPAHEVGASLPAAAAGDLSAADPDLRWAAAIAAFAEILKRSPFADPIALTAIDGIVAEQAARDQDRAEFATLYTKARSMLGGR